MWPIINTNIYICVCVCICIYMFMFFSTPNCRDHQVSSGIEFTYSIIMRSLTVLVCQHMQNDVIFIPCPKEEKYLKLRYGKHAIFIYDSCFSTKLVSYILLKLDDALNESVITICTTRTNLTCFTSDKLNKRNVCPRVTSNMAATRFIIKETAAYHFIGYYIGGYERAGRYAVFNFKALIGRYW